MTLTGLAKSLGVTRQTLYNKAKEAGIALDELRGQDGELTQYGIETLSGLCDSMTKRDSKSESEVDGQFTPDSSSVTEQDVKETMLDALEGANEAREVWTLRVQVAELQARLEAAEAATQREREALQAANQQSEYWRLQAERLLPAVTQTRQEAATRPGVFVRVWRGLFGK